MDVGLLKAISAGVGNLSADNYCYGYSDMYVYSTNDYCVRNDHSFAAVLIAWSIIGVTAIAAVS